jgi:lysyl-tRNA synthetase class 2
METLERLKNMKARLRKRAGLISAIRTHFDQSGFLEVDTPVIIKAPAPEEYIEGIPVEDNFLRTSPELQMKELLCSGYEKIYQIGPCFRRNEFGRKHRPEFTMLEWYQAHIDYMELLEFTVNLLRFSARKLNGTEEIKYQGKTIDLSLPPEIITVNDAYRKYAGIELADIKSEEEFDEIMTFQVEPCLGTERVTFLIDYPADRAALARLKNNNPEVAERWELYLCGIELANAYGELTDPVEQRQRFVKAQEIRAQNNFITYPFPEDFFDVLEHGMPECSGAALGVDRLAMIFTDAADIAEVNYGSL